MAELLDLDNSEWRRCPVMISSGWILSGKFVRFQTRLRNARTNSTARSAISHVGQRGRRGALETPHNECEPKKAEQSSKAMPAIHEYLRARTSQLALPHSEGPLRGQAASRW